MKAKLILLLLVCGILQVKAQDARQILDKASAAYNSAGGMHAVFTLNTEEVKQRVIHSQDGQAYLKGNKFKIDVPDGITWFDGKTQWVYAKGGDEVNVSNPTGDELAGVSPSVLLNIYKSGFKLVYQGEKKEGAKTVIVVDMIPQKSQDYSKMTVTLDKATYLFTSVSLYGTNGINNHLKIRKMQQGVNLPDNTFVFSKKDYPDVEIIDLR
ncbi:LolA family protein [Dysgonomonas macrotermitis]|uniref:Outer membrane lipoprotein-sorting protein n=1 Tax=Dysgonomonas macrotermitis TaxID=1346286 RepID=A0A1M4T075_9BACT|nr:LolA-like putative outer membrane lipoprotein chaperone [Dysgonomonas macrotermitis]SHE37888.1 Outer membrane lipoprotein-sorting protein [Dysgonomonas macrotermitis]